jgi:hypothetical protein
MKPVVLFEDPNGSRIYEEGVKEYDGSHRVIREHICAPAVNPDPVLKSPRGIRLLCQEVSDFPIVTLEDHNKWYSVFVVRKTADGETDILELRPSQIDELDLDDCDGLAINDNFHPTLLEQIAKHFDGEVDWRADEMAIGRWINEIGDLT